MSCRSVHIWEKVEITLQTRESYDNPYTDVTVWVDLEGPDFKKRVHGFWDGDNTYRVRLTLPTPGKWSWRSGASLPDAGLCGEPHYAGLADNPGFPKYEGWPDDKPIGSTEFDDALCRSGMYGSFLSGGFAGHIYGANYMWGGDIESASPMTMWDVMQWRSGAQMQYLRDFVLSEGARYQDLVPNSELVVPNKTAKISGNAGWAYCARTPERDLFMLYCETGAAQPYVRGALANSCYAAQWFNPRTGAWIDAGVLTADAWCRIELPALPSGEDWAMKLVLREGE